MPKPTQAEVADLVGRLRDWWTSRGKKHTENGFDAHRDVLAAADAIEALAGEGAEPTWDGNHDTAAEQAAEAGCAKPAGELPPLPEPVAHMWQHGETGNTGFVTNAPAEELEQWERMNRPRKLVCPMFAADQMRAYALRALRESR